MDWFAEIRRNGKVEQTLHNRRIGKKALLTFFVIVILLSAVVETRICRGGAQWLYFVLMWIPALAATVANCVSFRENREPFSFKKLFAKGGFRKCKPRCQSHPAGWRVLTTKSKPCTATFLGFLMRRGYVRNPVSHKLFHWGEKIKHICILPVSMYVRQCLSDKTKWFYQIIVWQSRIGKPNPAFLRSE